MILKFQLCTYFLTCWSRFTYINLIHLFKIGFGILMIQFGTKLIVVLTYFMIELYHLFLINQLIKQEYEISEM